MKAGQRTTTYSNPAPPAPKTPAKRVVKRVEPFSVWQKLVQERSNELGYSIRVLAAKIVSPTRKFEHSTVWAWLRSPEGTPPAETYTPDLNRRLAAALDIKPDRLAEAFEESRRRFVLADKTPSQQGPLSVLRTLFASSSRKTWKTEEIVKLIDDIRGN